MGVGQEVIVELLRVMNNLDRIAFVILSEMARRGWIKTGGDEEIREFVRAVRKELSL